MNTDLSKYCAVRDELAKLVAVGRRDASPSGTLNRYYDLLRLFDITCNRSKDGCVFAVYGSPKTGKSTLFNSLMGEAVLPACPIPTTGSIIDLRKDTKRSDYEVDCRRNGGISHRNYFPDTRGVCDFLKKYATQKTPCEKVIVTGPFPKAASFISHRCSLRDTPGAEALLDTETRVVDDRLREDSEKTLASLKEPCVPLFCVSARTIGQQQDMDFYSAHFRSKCCLHVITHIDAVSTDLGDPAVTAKAERFREVFGVFPSSDCPNPIVCTGILNRPGGDRFVNIGLQELCDEMKVFLDPSGLGARILDTATFVLNHGIDWDDHGKKEIIFEHIRQLLHA